MKPKQTTPFLNYLLYGMAIVILFAAIWLLFTAFNFSRVTSTLLGETLEAFGPSSGVLANLLKNAVSIIGLVFAGLALTISALLFTAAQILKNFILLSDRVSALESKLEASKEAPPEA